MPEHAAAAALPAAPALSPLQHMLAAGIAALRCEPDGAELYAALERSAGAELALLDQPQLGPADTARLRALAGRVCSVPRLAQLIRGGIAESVAEALGNPAAWLLACRALKHIPAWALEEPAERSARLAADNERRRGPGRPGQRARDSAGAREPGARGYSAAQPPAGPLGRSYGAVHWAAGGPPAPAHEPGAAQPPDLEQEQLLRQGAADEEWTDPQLERELREIAALWQGHDPALPERVDATRHGVKHYLQLCRQLDPLDVAVLDSNMLPPRYDLSAATLPELIVRVKRVWADLAAGGTPPGDALCDPRSGAPISRELAQRRLAELREVGQ